MKHAGIVVGTGQDPSGLDTVPNFFDARSFVPMTTVAISQQAGQKKEQKRNQRQEGQAKDWAAAGHASHYT
jgi:hypothetical protein